MTFRVLANDQVDQFITLGFVKPDEAFPHAKALAAQDFLWRKLEALGFPKDDRSTWTSPMVHVKELGVFETEASPGDVVFCHPFLYHAAAQHLSRNPRFMCNKTTALKGPMKLYRSDGDYAPVEVCIREALANTNEKGWDH